MNNCYNSNAEGAPFYPSFLGLGAGSVAGYEDSCSLDFFLLEAEAQERLVNRKNRLTYSFSNSIPLVSGFVPSQPFSSLFPGL